MKLIMTGGGESEHFEAIDQYFISSLKQDPSLLFIPLAGNPKHFNDGMERINETFSTIQFEKIEMCLDLAELEWSYLKKFDAIYIDGGNTFPLMQEIRNTHFYELLHRFLHHGGVVNGDSAGAIILGSHLETAHFGDTPDENETDVISYQGLNLIGNYAIHCHYQDTERKEVEGFVREFGFPVIALYENSALSIKNQSLSVFGEAPVLIFTEDNIQEIAPFQKTKLS
jgi:dipeptidase E